MNDPTQQGLPIIPETPIKYRDMFDKVYQEWLTAQPSTAAITAVETFLTKAREMFSRNQPIAQDFMGDTLSLRFQDGSVLPVCEAVNPTIAGGDGGAMHVAAQHAGKGKIAPSGSWGVTGSP